MNIPYVKEFNFDGTVSNPINGMYENNSPNRKQRRLIKQSTPFHGNSKNFHLTVSLGLKYQRFRQVIILKDGSRKTIEHYILR